MHDQDRPRHLPRYPVPTKDVSQIICGALRHNHSLAVCRDDYHRTRKEFARRDTGDWVRSHEFYDAVYRTPRCNKTNGGLLAEEYAHHNLHEFRTQEQAFLGGSVAGVAGTPGGRVAVLLAAVDTGACDRFYEPEEGGMRYCLRPLAMRICEGHSERDHLFLEELRMNCRLTEPMTLACQVSST